MNLVMANETSKSCTDIAEEPPRFAEHTKSPSLAGLPIRERVGPASGRLALGVRAMPHQQRTSET